ncbi:MAG: GNAT family N-acetyltransferase, partial [Acidobacteria bacterium]|nr:GNAT family N-acetyltransferase [Acidobacteriota bacterium]
MPSPSDCAIVPFRPELREAFERLNRRWLEDHGLLEPVDLEYLQDPEGHILANGGQVLFALRDGEAVGTCAILRLSPSTVELAKLAVSPDAQGMGLGRRLCVEALAVARALGAHQIVQKSKKALVAANKHDQTQGFRHQPIPP